MSRDIYKKKKNGPFARLILMATTAGFAVPRAFFRSRTRCGIHFARIIALCFAAAVGAVHFIGIYAHKLVEFLAAVFAFVL